MSYERDKRREKRAQWIAWHLPKRVAYWAFIRVAVHDVDEYPGDQTVAEVAAREAP